jgi:hypothetical protein
MGVTRKERLLKAMLEDNASACSSGVTRFEKMLAGVAKKTCDNDALEGGGGGGGGMPEGGVPNMQLVTDSDGNTVWEEKTHYAGKQWNMLADDSIGSDVLGRNSYHIDNGDNERPWIQSESVRIIINGITYDTQKKYIRYNNDEYYIYGNASMMSSTLEDTGENFCLSVRSFFMACSHDLYYSEPIQSFAIYEPREVVVPLDEKFMPDTIARKSDIGILVVNVTYPDPNLPDFMYVDKNYSEIQTAYNNGKAVFIRKQDNFSEVWERIAPQMLLPLISVGGGQAIFCGMYLDDTGEAYICRFIFDRDSGNTWEYHRLTGVEPSA